MDRVAVIGGGLAGLAAATALAKRGFQVTLLESRRRLGGRAGSFVDPASGQHVDACQHVSMGCCTNLAHFLRTIGVDRFLAPQPTLHFLTPDRRRSAFRADSWPAPFHLGRALLGAHYLTPVEKARVAWGMTALARVRPDDDPPLLDWLLTHRQTERTIDRFWGVVLVSALNERVQRLGLKYARKVFVDGFLRHRGGHVVHVPTVPLGRLYGEELRDWLQRHGIELREASAAIGVTIAPSARPLRADRIVLRNGGEVTADWYVLAVPFDRVLELLPDKVAASEPYFANLRHLTHSPITSVHFWFDRPVLDLPHAVLVESESQWVFNRGEVAPGEHYVQVVVSASAQLKALGREEIERRIALELAGFFPRVRMARTLRSRVVTEHAATFSAVPGVDRWRPNQASPVVNLALAGDWTATGWPATMEGAVRSGYLAAEAILARAGQPARVLRKELWE